MKMKSLFVHIGLLSFLATGSSLVLAAVSNSSQTSQSPAEILPEVKVKDLNRHPEKFANSKVAVSGKVAQIEGPEAFVLEGSGFFNNKILVLVEKPAKSSGSNQQAGTAAPVIKEKEKVQVIGRVEEIGLTKIEAKYGPLKSEIKEEFEGVMPVLIVPPSGIKVQS